MSAFVYTNAFVSIDGNDLSDACRSAQLSLDAAAVDANTMGTDWAKLLSGVKSATLDTEWLDDFAAGQIDATLWPLFGTLVPFVFRPDAGAIGEGNPEFTGTIHIGSHQVGGSHGDAGTKTMSFSTSGAVARATSA